MKTQFLNPELLEAIGMTIFHSLWIIPILYLLFYIIDKILIIYKLDVNIRYWFKLFGYFSIIVFSVIIFKNQLYLGQTTFKQNESIHLQSIDLQQYNQSTESKPTEQIITIHPFLEAKNIGLIWVLGMFILSIRLIGMYFITMKLYYVGTTNLGANEIFHCQKLQKLLKINRLVQFKCSSLIRSPITIGFLKPIILFPVQFFNHLEMKQAEAIILHELAHIKRYDYLINIFQSILDIVFFYHPIVWWWSKEIRKYREYSCDYTAMNLGVTNLEYAYALTNLQLFFQSQKNQLVMNANPTSFRDRIHFILYKATPKNYASPIISILAIVTTFSLLCYSPIDAKLPISSDLSITNFVPKLPEVTPKVEQMVKHRDAQSTKKTKENKLELLTGTTDTITLFSEHKVMIPKEYSRLHPYIMQVDNKYANVSIQQFSDYILLSNFNNYGYYYLKLVDDNQEIKFQKLFYAKPYKFKDPITMLNNNNSGNTLTKDELLKRFELTLSYSDPKAAEFCSIVSYNVVFLPKGKDPTEILFSNKNNFNPDKKQYLIQSLSDGSNIMIKDIICTFKGEISQRNLGMITYKISDGK